MSGRPSLEALRKAQRRAQEVKRSITVERKCSICGGLFIVALDRAAAKVCSNEVCRKALSAKRARRYKENNRDKWRARKKRQESTPRGREAKLRRMRVRAERLRALRVRFCSECGDVEVQPRHLFCALCKVERRRRLGREHYRKYGAKHREKNNRSQRKRYALNPLELATRKAKRKWVRMYGEKVATDIEPLLQARLELHRDLGMYQATRKPQIRRP